MRSHQGATVTICGQLGWRNLCHPYYPGVGGRYAPRQVVEPSAGAQSCRRRCAAELERESQVDIGWSHGATKAQFRGSATSIGLVTWCCKGLSSWFGNVNRADLQTVDHNRSGATQQRGRSTDRHKPSMVVSRFTEQPALREYERAVADPERVAMQLTPAACVGSPAAACLLDLRKDLVCGLQENATTVSDRSGAVNQPQQEQAVMDSQLASKGQKEPIADDTRQATEDPTRTQWSTQWR